MGFCFLHLPNQRKMSRTMVNKVLNANQIRTGAKSKRFFGMALKMTLPANSYGCPNSEEAYMLVTKDLKAPR
ncbi:unnamed protein product [Brassica rapa]|uniref:Uncharacterized protein n=2 Tax=Brassica TaxID=3705 RepID=A0A8D9M3A9_BRACM|nr:unnamed protein product [Brassica napus]CAG7896753.1 unnamed protein product [Brassica rapa]